MTQIDKAHRNCQAHRRKTIAKACFCVIRCCHVVSHFSFSSHSSSRCLDRVITYLPIRNRSPDVTVRICALRWIVSKVQVRGWARSPIHFPFCERTVKPRFLSAWVVMTVGSLTKSFCGLRESCKPINFISGWLRQFGRASDEFWLIRLEPRVGVNKHSTDNYAPSTHNSSQERC